VLELLVGAVVVLVHLAVRAPQAAAAAHRDR